MKNLKLRMFTVALNIIVIANRFAAIPVTRGKNHGLTGSLFPLRKKLSMEKHIQMETIPAKS
jgi:hypothetical protein